MMASPPQATPALFLLQEDPSPHPYHLYPFSTLIIPQTGTTFFRRDKVRTQSVQISLCSLLSHLLNW